MLQYLHHQIQQYNVTDPEPCSLQHPGIQVYLHTQLICFMDFTAELRGPYRFVCFIKGSGQGQLTVKGSSNRMLPRFQESIFG